MTNRINIRRANHTDVSRWAHLYQTNKHSNFFQRPEWPSLLEAALGLENQTLVIEDEHDMIGVLPLSEVRNKIFGNSICSLPFCSYAGPLLNDQDNPLVIAKITEKTQELARKRKVSRLEIRGKKKWSENSPDQTLYVSFIGPIPESLHDLRGVPQKRRNMIRKAQTLGVSSSVHRDADRFYELYAENCRNHGTPGLGRQFFRSLIETFNEDVLDILTVTNKQGQDVSTILNFYHQSTVMAYFAGENMLARQCNANDYKYWALMQHARTKGYTTFDFGRSKQGTGSYQFKTLWGFRPTQLHYEFLYLPSGKVPQNNPSNPKFSMAIKLWQRLPRTITDLAGPILVRGLG